MHIVRFPDVQARTIGWLRQFFPAAEIRPEPPPGWRWDRLLITVTDVGGPGARDVVMDDVTVTVEVSHPDQAAASAVAQQVYGLLREWPYHQAGVYFRGTVQRPTWWPEDETRTPLYKLTCRLAFRGELVEVPTN